jgi:hypothetical protein
MRKPMRTGLGLVCCAALAACASKPAAPLPDERWSGKDSAHLAADQADCRREADAVDVRQAAGYSDPRYGVTSAMAAAVAEDNPLVNETAAIRLAAFDACMNDKGWKAQ